MSTRDVAKRINQGHCAQSGANAADQNVVRLPRNLSIDFYSLDTEKKKKSA